MPSQRKRFKPILLLIAATLLALPAAATGTEEVIDFDRFVEDSRAAREARASRLLPVEEFLVLAADPDTVLLDTRSAEAYARLHLAGAAHLEFSDITESSLERVLGDRDRTVLIYCNNNFAGDVEPFLTKAAPAALNIPTYVTLWIYGYRNVYELGDLLEFDDSRIRFEGRDAGVAAATPAGVAETPANDPASY